MRFRDMRWYIILSVIFITSSIVLAFIYVLPVKSKMESTILNETKNVTESKCRSIETILATYEFIFQNNNENSSDFTIIEDKDLDYLTRFQNSNLIITKEKFIVGSPTLTEENYAIYIYDADDDRIGALSFDKVFKDYASDEIYFLYSTDGEIISSNYTYTLGTTFYSLLNSKDNAAYNSVIENNQTDNSIFTKFISFDSESYLGLSKIENLYYAHIIDSSGYTVSISTINSQVIIFYSGFAGILVLVFVIMILGFKKSSKLLMVDKNNFKKSQAIVIRMKINGQVIFINKTLRSILGPKTKFNNIRQFNVEKYSNIVECYRKEQEFIASIDVNDKIHYFNLVSVLSGKDYYLIGFDITKQYLNNQFLLAMSSKNPITKMDNMLTMASNYVDIIEASEKLSTTFVYINVLNFRETNKVFSRKVGDSILLQLSKIIANVFANMKVYHIDADRFIVVVQTSNPEAYNLLCEKLVTSLKAPIQVNNNHIYLSIKISTYVLNYSENSEISLDEIRGKLDIAMEKAKSTLNKTIVAYDSSLELYMNATYRMEVALQKAIKNDEFVMHFQPQYDIFKNKIVSFEALIRWNHPEYGKQSPQAFIELAEQNGYILDIGKYVIQSSFRAAKELEKYNCHVSINVSPAQIFQAGFVSDLISEFEKNQLKPGSIAIEITETFVMENFDIVIEKLKILKRQGFSIHMDDFGTGYSSMLYLKDLPIDTLKIDKEFTKTIEIDKFSLAMVKKICSMGQDLNLDIICEGVETQGQSNLLKSMGCKIIQGWLIGKAMPLEDAIKSIEHYNGKLGETKIEKNSSNVEMKTNVVKKTVKK